MNPTILTKLDLTPNDFINGLNAKNNKDELVLKYNSWLSDYVGNDEIRDEIPKLDGAELIIRKDYFEQICNLYSVAPSYCTFKTGDWFLREVKIRRSL